MKLAEFKKFSHNGRGYPERGHKDPDRGPHEGKELKMMLDGVKPAAVINGEFYFTDGFDDAVKAGKLISKEYKDRMGEPSYIVALPTEERRMNTLARLMSMSWEEIEKQMSDDTYHARLGRLLGYTKDQIRKFIDNDFKDPL